MTNRWKVDAELVQGEVWVIREQDNIPMFRMCTEADDEIPHESELLNQEEALDVAQQIVDDWNFTCDELETD